MTADAERIAQAAARLLDDPLLKAALDEIEAAAVKDWRNSRPDDTAGRERNWLMVKAVEALRTALMSRVTTGKLAAKRG